MSEILRDPPEGDRDDSPAFTEGASGSVQIDSASPAWAGLRPFRVAEIVCESRQTASFVLEPVDGKPLPSYRPGQYLTVSVLPAGAQRALQRSFSLSEAHDAQRYRLSIKREPDGLFSQHMHDAVEPGDVIDVGAPRVMFTLDPAHGREPVVLVSAGIGATPMVAMLESYRTAGRDRDVRWIYGARSRAEHAFADEVRRHVAALPRARSHICYSRPARLDVRGRDYDAEGRVTLDVLRDVGVPREARYYLNGPTAWMRGLVSGLLNWGVAPESLLCQ